MQHHRLNQGGSLERSAARREWDNSYEQLRQWDSASAGTAMRAVAFGAQVAAPGIINALSHHTEASRLDGRWPSMTSLPTTTRLQTLIVVLDVIGRRVGLPIDVVQDVVRVQRAGPGQAWRVHRSSVRAICPPGMLAVGDRCVPLVELSDELGMAPPSCVRRMRSVVVVQSGEHIVGQLVDAVTDIAEAPCASIRSAGPDPDQHPAMRMVAQVNAQAVELVDIDRLLCAPTVPLALRRAR